MPGTLPDYCDLQTKPSREQTIVLIKETDSHMARLVSQAGPLKSQAQKRATEVALFK
jgi:hypothetical protein